MIPTTKFKWTYTRNYGHSTDNLQNLILPYEVKLGSITLSVVSQNEDGQNKMDSHGIVIVLLPFLAYTETSDTSECFNK